MHMEPGLSEAWEGFLMSGFRRCPVADGLLGTHDKPAQAGPAQGWVPQAACLLAAGDLNPLVSNRRGLSLFKK